MNYYYREIDKSEEGSITVVALIILVVLTFMGLSISRTTTTDIQIAGNELFRKQYFYVAEGGMHREAQEVGSGNYAVTDIYASSVIATQSSGGLPGPAHQVMGDTYDFTLSYLGYYIPPKGYSATDFSRFDYDIDVSQKGVSVQARYYKIGPSAN